MDEVRWRQVLVSTRGAHGVPKLFIDAAHVVPHLRDFNPPIVSITQTSNRLVTVRVGRGILIKTIDLAPCHHRGCAHQPFSTEKVINDRRPTKSAPKCRNVLLPMIELVFGDPSLSSEVGA